MAKAVLQTLVAEQKIRHRYMIRAQKVMPDRDLAEMYGVETKALNQGVKRSIKRFPKDFMFNVSEKSGTTCGHKLLPQVGVVPVIAPGYKTQ